MLKKLVSIVFLLWYTTLSFGFQVHLHYCCGNLAGIELIHIEVEDDASCCDSHHDGCHQKKGCCSSEDIYLNFDEDQQFTNVSIDLPTLIDVKETVSFQVFDDEFTSVETPVDQMTNGPPLYLLFAQRLHYG